MQLLMAQLLCSGKLVFEQAGLVVDPLATQHLDFLTGCNAYTC